MGATALARTTLLAASRTGAPHGFRSLRDLVHGGTGAKSARFFEEVRGGLGAGHTGTTAAVDFGGREGFLDLGVATGPLVLLHADEIRPYAVRLEGRGGADAIRGRLGEVRGGERGRSGVQVKTVRGSTI